MRLEARYFGKPFLPTRTSEAPEHCIRFSLVLPWRVAANLYLQTLGAIHRPDAGTRVRAAELIA